jgi:hypothetical protein
VRVLRGYHAKNAATICAKNVSETERKNVVAVLPKINLLTIDEIPMQDIDLKSTNKMIETLSTSIALLEQEEIAILKYVSEKGPTFDTESTQKAFLANQVQGDIDFLNEHIAILNKITEVQAEGDLRFLDADPFRIAILRLQAAIQQAQSACGD